MKPYKNRTIESGDKVRVHRNLHKGGFSVIAMTGPFKGLVVAHCEAACIDNVSFVVSKKGWQRYINSGVKNVHAFIEGNVDLEYVVPQWDPKRGWYDGLFHRASDPLRTWSRIVYEPALRPHFKARNRNVSEASTVVLRSEYEILGLNVL